MNQEFRMRASLVNNASKPLREIQKDLASVGKGNNLAGLRREAGALSTSFSAVGSTLRGVVIPAFSTMAFSAGAAVLSFSAAGARMREFAARTADMRFAAKEFGVTTQLIKGFVAEAGKMRIAPEEAMSGLQTFFKNAEDFRLKIGGLREELFKFGAGDIVAAIARAKDQTDALRIAFERMQHLQRTNPAVARRFAEAVFGSAKFARMGWEELLKTMGEFKPRSKEQEDAAQALHEAFERLGRQWRRIGENLNYSLAPGMLATSTALADMLEQNPEALAPINRALEEMGKAIAAIPKDDLRAIGEAVGDFIKKFSDTIAQDIRDFAKLISLIKEATAAIKDFITPDFKGRASEQTGRIDRLKGQRGELDRLIEQTPEGTARSRMIAQRDQLDKQIKALEDGLKKLEEEVDKTTKGFQKMNFIGGPGGGGGVMNASYGGGGFGRQRLNPRGFGSLDFPAVDDPTGEGGSGAGRRDRQRQSVFDTGTNPWGTGARGRSSFPGGKFRGTGDHTLDAIIAAEGTAKRGDPFNETLGYGRYGTPEKPLTDMTLREAYQFGRSIRRRHGSSSAIGAFQIVGQTMKDVGMPRTGLTWDDKFSAENQMKMAHAIRQAQGLRAWEGFKHHPDQLMKARRGGTYALDNPAFARGARSIDYLDQSIGGQPVSATGTVNVNVAAPRGTTVTADSDGMFQSTQINRTTQMPALPAWAAQ